MSYLPVPFPSEIAPEPTGGPSYSTDLASTLSGDEQRNQNWSEARHTYEMSHGIKTARDFKKIGAHFRMAKGRLHMFRVTDWADFECARDEGVLMMITSTEYQLAKQYGDEPGFLVQRRITRPIVETVEIWKDNVPTTGYTLSAETGRIVFDSAPGASVLECAFNFDVPCRYDTDQLKAILVNLVDSDESLISWDTVPLAEVHE